MLKSVEELKVEEKIKLYREKYGIPEEFMFNVEKLQASGLTQEEIDTFIEYEKIYFKKK